MPMHVQGSLFFGEFEADASCGAVPIIHLVYLWAVTYKPMNGSAT
jgi:hypothetical protein